MTDYIDADDLRQWLNIADGDDDVRLTYAVSAASRAIEKYCGQVFHPDTAATARVFHTDDPYRCEVDPISSSSGVIVKTDTGNTGTFATTWTVTTDYVLYPYDGIVDGVTAPYTEVLAVGGLIFPTWLGRVFPPWANRARVQVTAKWGWPAVPADVQFACRLKAAKLFRRASSPDGMAGGLDTGVVRISRYEDPDVAQLLSPFKSVQAMVA